MGWVNDARRELAAGRQVQVQPFGGSMRGRIESGQLVTLAPANAAEVRVGDVVFVAWKGNYLLHLVKEVHDGQFLICNACGTVSEFVAPAIHRAIAGQAADLGFAVGQQTIEVRGICRSCRGAAAIGDA